MKVIHLSIVKNIETTKHSNNLIKIDNFSENIEFFPNEIRRNLLKETKSL
jgi:hypothetical protein